MDAIRKAPELNYMTQIVFMLFEDVNKPEDSLDKYHVDIHFSPGIKGRAELATDGSSSLVKKSSPELPEKSPPKIFVKRLPHIGIIGSSESGVHVHVPGTCGGVLPSVSRAKPTVLGDGLSGVGPDSSATMITTHDFFRRYVTASRSAAAAALGSNSSTRLSPQGDMLGVRRTSMPNNLRSFSDTRLVDKSSKMEEHLEREEEGHGQGHTHRKKSASDSLLESMQEFTFRIANPTTHRYMYMYIVSDDIQVQCIDIVDYTCTCSSVQFKPQQGGT